MARLFRCDYCGGLVPTDRVELFFIHAYDMDNPDDELVTTGIYCSDPCAEWSAGRAGSNRGGGDYWMATNTGNIIGPVHKHGPGVRFGVIVAPEPSQRVERLLSDDEATWKAELAAICSEAGWPLPEGTPA